MASKTLRTMTAGNPAKLILLFSLPLMVGNIFQQLYTVVDTVVVGQALGVSALAALGACDWINWLVLGLVRGLGQGFSILMAQRFGAGDEEGLKKVTGNSVLLAAGAALFFLALSQLLARPMLLMLDTPAQIIESSLSYLRIIFGGIPVVMAYNLLSAMLRALGDGKTPLYAMIIASLTNVALDVLFVFGFHWGIEGAAGATVMAQCISAVYCFLRIRRISVLRVRKAHFRLDRSLSIRLLGLGFPIAFQEAIISVGGMIVQSVVNGFGVLFIAGFTATNKLYGVLEVAAISYGYALTTYTGQNYGAKNAARISLGMKYSLYIAMGFSLIISTCMFVFGRNILSMFISGTPDQAAQTLQIAFSYLSIMSIFLPILYLLHVFRSCIQGMGGSVLSMVSGIAEFLMRTVCALALPLLVGSQGIFFAEVLAWFGADAVLIPSYFHCIRAARRLVSSQSAAAGPTDPPDPPDPPADAPMTVSPSA